MIEVQIFICAAVLGLVLSPFAGKLAVRWNIVDRPDGHRKLHQRVVPLAGGVAVYLASVIALLLPAIYDEAWRMRLYRNGDFLAGLLISATTILLIGILDDRFKIRGRQKLVGQCIASLVVVISGLAIDEIAIFGVNWNLGVFAIPFTVFWLVCAVNALNLIDGLDGLATTVGIIMSLTFAALAAMTNHYLDGMIALTMAGALSGFLYYNWAPARMFLGDAGSMLVGLVLGALAIRSSLKGQTTVSMAAPLAAWAVLFFDVGMAVLRRKLTGQSIYATDRGHLHHIMQKRGFTPQGAVSLMAVLCLLCALGALASVYLKNETLAMVTPLAVLACLVLTRFFGHSEVWLLSRKAYRLLASCSRLPNRKDFHRAPFVSRFHGKREWDRLWESLVEFSERFDIDTVQMNVSSPVIGEEYHATWERRSTGEERKQWNAKIPLYARSISVGHIVLSGTVPNGTPFEWMSELLDGLKPFELQLQELLESGDLPPQTTALQESLAQV